MTAIAALPSQDAALMTTALLVVNGGMLTGGTP
jgi:hypothetical protein